MFEVVQYCKIKLDLLAVAPHEILRFITCTFYAYNGVFILLNCAHTDICCAYNLHTIRGNIGLESVYLSLESVSELMDCLICKQR